MNKLALVFILLSYNSAWCAGPILSNVEVVWLTSSEATIVWNTDLASDSQVEYGVSQSYGKSSPLHINRVISHSVVLRDLQPGSLYHFRAKSRDEQGNLTVSDDFDLTTLLAGVKTYELPVTQVTASDDNGNIPENTLDDSLNTMWSAYGDGQWIEYDLGSTYTVSYLTIAFYRGTERVLSFDIQVSTDRITWISVFQGASSGNTPQQEEFDFPDNLGRYVRIVGHMNNENAWNSITEVDIFGIANLDAPENLRI